MAGGLIITAPRSGDGKTFLTLGLLRYFARHGVIVVAAKIGPDYIDPAFHAAASGQPCLSLDTWAMRPETVRSLVARLTAESGLVVIEGVMGLFEGASGTTINTVADGSTASIAMITGWPVIMVVDVRGQTVSAAATVQGFARFHSNLRLAGVILNRVSGPHHVEAVRAAMARHVPEVVVLGAIPEEARLKLSTRHLGLVQARELPDLDTFLERAADVVSRYVDLESLQTLARPACLLLPPRPTDDLPVLLPLLGQRIAVALDDAFTFVYPVVLKSWYERGAEIIPFSPLNNESPPASCDAVYLPGGYPELHAGLLASNARFMAGLRMAASRSDVIFGECGGYMVLGHALVDIDGNQHSMSGVLPLSTSFAQKHLHLGYRVVTLMREGPLGSTGIVFRGHEFHYATLLSEGPGEPLFSVTDATGQPLGQAGLRCRNVMGSFIHLIDTVDHGYFCRPSSGRWRG
ncbi:Cobyrinic acid A,C-diamide synthase [invertebrate metagenome]|uniref:Cobyrinic acid A,C-diamide synthase n=1 Tax=invertebrate metagenome TaxID=1711999 RepID=A0A484H756_9ZZZZ